MDFGGDANAATCDDVAPHEVAVETDGGADNQVREVDDTDGDVDDAGDSATVEAHVVRALPPDDNDLIVVVDDQQHGTPLSSSVGKAHRQEYRQLFSKLRQE